MKNGVTITISRRPWPPLDPNVTVQVRGQLTVRVSRAVTLEQMKDWTSGMQQALLARAPMQPVKPKARLNLLIRLFGIGARRSARNNDVTGMMKKTVN